MTVVNLKPLQQPLGSVTKTAFHKGVKWHPERANKQSLKQQIQFGFVCQNQYKISDYKTPLPLHLSVEISTLKICVENQTMKIKHAISQKVPIKTSYQNSLKVTRACLR